MAEDNKPNEPEVKVEGPLVETAAQRHGFNIERGRTPGMTQVSGLVEVENSPCPAYADGTVVSHVMAPGQMAVDPVAAGIDTKHVPLTRAENRVITRTGQDGSGNLPSTYAQHEGPNTSDKILKPVTDHSEVVAPEEAIAAAAPGPNAQPAANTTVKKDENRIKK